MHHTKKAGLGIAAACTLFLGLTGTAFADGYGDGAKAAPADEGRKFTWSVTFAGTSDIMFRGLSQTKEDPGAWGSLDLGYGIVYAGVYFGQTDYPGVAAGELDFYLGAKPVWGPVTFDFGVIYYVYPGSAELPNPGGNADYVELKAGGSITPMTNLTLGVTNYWSPDNQFSTGSVWTIEGSAAYTFHAVGIFTPTISGVYGFQEGFDDAYITKASAFGEDSYQYWNVGLALAVEKFTFDFRYWGTDEPATVAGGDCTKVAAFNCDDRFVFSAKVTLP
jgi:uncharacterized protein (TIGR02001 family)